MIPRPIIEAPNAQPGLLRDAPFVDTNITPKFKEGLTIVDSDGQWMMESGEVIKEDSKILILLYDNESSADVDDAISEYRVLTAPAFYDVLSTTIRFVLKPLVFAASLGPLAWLVWAGLTGNLSANPLSDLTNETGTWALRCSDDIASKRTRPDFRCGRLDARSTNMKLTCPPTRVDTAASGMGVVDGLAATRCTDTPVAARWAATSAARRDLPTPATPASVT